MITPAHDINIANNCIMGWYIDSNICDKLLEIHRTGKQEPGAFGEDLVVDKDIKDSIDVCLGPDQVPQYYINALFECVNSYMDHYTHSQVGEIGLTESTLIQYYPPGGGYKSWHMERSGLGWPMVTRHFVFMTYLNDVEEGGTEFLYQKCLTKAQKGLTLIWPTDWPWTHRGQVSHTQEKYIITGWLNMRTQPLEKK